MTGENPLSDPTIPERITPERDAELRLQLAELYGKARAVVDIADSGDGQHWPVHPTSTAAIEHGVNTGLWSYIAAELEWDKGLNLPLTQARALLNDAAACFEVIAAITCMSSEPARLAGISPVARSAAEKAATVHWVLTGAGDRPAGGDRLGRLTRSLVVEITGIESLLKFYPEIETADLSSQLRAARKRFIELGEAECGPAVYTKNSGRLLSIAGVALPSLTERVSAATMNASYAEQSAGTHPTGHSTIMSSDSSTARHGILSCNARSTVHGEGRLIEPAVIAFGRAVANVGSLIGPTEQWPLANWGPAIAKTWESWCTENGCK